MILYNTDVRHPIGHWDRIRIHGRQIKKALHTRAILTFPMPSLASTRIGVYEDNKGAIDLAKNTLSSSNSKHIDVRHHMPREMASSGDIVFIFDQNVSMQMS